jgi:hypothetical protein
MIDFLAATTPLPNWLIIIGAYCLIAAIEKAERKPKEL